MATVTEGASSASSSSADTTEKNEVIKKMLDLLAQGKRNMVCGEVPKAVSLFEEAVQLVVQRCGELSRDCADAYFNCGSALLELGRMETNVLGTALEGVEVEEEKDEETSEQFEKPPPDEGEERQKLREEVYEAMAEGDREEEMKKKLTNGTTEVKDDDKMETGVNGGEQVDSSDVKKIVDEEKGKKTSVEEDMKDAGSMKDSCKETDKEIKSEKMKDASSVVDSSKETPDKDKTESSQKEVESSEAKEVEILKEKAEDGKVLAEVNEPNKMETENCDNKKSEQVEDLDKKNEDKINGEKPVKEVSETENDKAKGEKPVKEVSETENKENDKAKGEKPVKEVSETENKENDKAKGEKPVKDVSEIENKESDKTNVANEDTKEEGKATTEDEVKETKAAEKDGDVEMTEEEEKGAAEGEGGEEADDGEETAEGEESQEGEEENDEEKEEDVPNFQLAWEYLDLAKVIYLKSETKEDQLKAAECHIKLGELSMETEQHATAAEDLESALKIQQKHLSADDRLIAETHYQLGLAYGLGKEFELSIQHYQQAISVIEAKIASLNKLVEENEVDAEDKENRETDDLKKYKDEIKELQELIPEMRNKIEDTRVEAKDMEQMKQMAKEMLGLSGTTKGFGSPTKKADAGAASGSGDVDENGEKKASDIAHLVRKKRKPEEEAPAPTAQEIKKLRQEENSAGDATTKDAAEMKVNGHADSSTQMNGNHDNEQKETSTTEAMATS